MKIVFCYEKCLSFKEKENILKEYKMDCHEKYESDEVSLLINS